ncbi:hypothetical protein A0H81_06477 [Grifola frondosa]|uniref:Uncharacterized protein n=1 Tax=Grifola frondosa TaxID=5627 RepID=A0A1C7MAY1_GRIFR|nr:hypothetical protein A0H81_06477 [Grifola frondosa]
MPSSTSLNTPSISPPVTSSIPESQGQSIPSSTEESAWGACVRDRDRGVNFERDFAEILRTLPLFDVASEKNERRPSDVRKDQLAFEPSSQQLVPPAQNHLLIAPAIVSTSTRQPPNLHPNISMNVQQLEQEFICVPSVQANLIKAEIGCADKDLSGLTLEEKHRILEIWRWRTGGIFGTPSGSIPDLGMPPYALPPIAPRPPHMLNGIHEMAMSNIPQGMTTSPWMNIAMGPGQVHSEWAML